MLQRTLKDAARRMIQRAGYRIENLRYVPRPMQDHRNLRLLTFDDVICRLMFKRGPSLRFLQVGAYDGLMADPLWEYTKTCGWRGVMVEPQPGPASRLREYYSDCPAIQVIQAAVDARPGTRTLYTAEGSDLPAWVGTLGSFNRNHFARFEDVAPGIGEAVRATEVPCLTFNDILDEAGLNDLDLLQIDVEGADAYVLSLFPFERIKPRVVQWESGNLPLAEQESALSRLAAIGYRFARSGAVDTVATLDV